MKGILINYDYCTGCHSCEVACKVVHELNGWRDDYVAGEPYNYGHEYSWREMAKKAGLEVK